MPSIIPDIALVTGAARRVGAAIVRYLHERGYQVILHYRGHADEAKQLAEELNQQRPDSVRLLCYDLSKMADIHALADAAKACWGSLNLLVNNASGFSPTPFGQVTEAKWDELQQSNVKSAFFLTQALTPMLVDNQGSVVNMLDIHASNPLKGYSAYSVAKAGLLMVTKSLAFELAPSVRVNGIAPGFMLLSEGENSLSDESYAEIRQCIPLHCFGGALPVAEAVYYLAKATYVTGSILTVDGGRHLRM